MTTSREKIQVRQVFVDSGQLLITDPCYLDMWACDDANSVNKDLNIPIDPDDFDLPYSYGGACAASCSIRQAGTLNGGDGVSVQTGYGDGFYPVSVEYEDGRVKRVIVDFF